MIIATDFDGTLCTHRFPNIGEEAPHAINVLKKLREKGHKVFLWTMRGHPDLSRFPHVNKDTGEYIPQDTLQEALDWCKERGLEFDGVNESPEQFSTSPKQYAKLYIDDAAFGCPLKTLHAGIGYVVDWEKIAVSFMEAGIFTQTEFLDIMGIYHGHKIPEGPSI